jgi:predicted Zn-dependent protease
MNRPFFFVFSIIAMLSLALGGCARPDVTLVVQEGFTPEQRADIEAVVAEWQTHAVSQLQVRFEGEARDSEWKVRLLPKGTEGVLSSKQVEAYEDDAVPEIGIYQWRLRCSFRRTFSHEVGHALGLPHSDAGIMHPTDCLDNVGLLTERDLASCRDAGVCK